MTGLIQVRTVTIAGATALFAATAVMAQQPPSQTGSSRRGDQTPAPVNTPHPSTAFDFDNADINAVIKAITQASGLNVMYSGIPARKVSMRVAGPLGHDDAIRMLRSLSESNGLKFSDDSGLVTISSIQASTSAQRPAGTTASGDDNMELFVYRLKHADASRLASVLQAIFNGGAAPAGATGITQPTLSQSLQQQTQSGYGQTFGGGGGFGGGGTFGGGGGFGGGRGTTSGTTTQTYRVGGGGGGGGAFGPLSQLLGLNGQRETNPIVIVPEEATNSLLVRADPEAWSVIKQTIDAVDLRPLQVIIEVMIAEVQRSEDLDVGISANGNNSRTFNGRTLGSVSMQGDTTSNFIANFTRYGAVDINVAIAALKSRGDVKILSLPLVFAQNNTESQLLVGEQRPFIQSYRTYATDNTAQDQIVQYQQVGTSLIILPTINPDGYVNLQVQQQVSQATTEIQFGAPVISSREAQAQLFVKDGQTVVVGGLTGTQEEKTRTGIPLLSDIPFLGGLFGSTSKTSVRQELYLFLTPHIVESDSDVDRIRQDLQAKSALMHATPIQPIITTPVRPPRSDTAGSKPIEIIPRLPSGEPYPHDSSDAAPAPTQNTQPGFPFPSYRRRGGGGGGGGGNGGGGGGGGGGNETSPPDNPSPVGGPQAGDGVTMPVTSSGTAPAE